MSDNEPVLIYNAWSLVQAHLVAQMLANAGITARIASHALEMVTGDIPFQKATVPVWVAAKDADVARTIVAEFQETSRRSKSTANSDAIDFCYHCGANCAPDEAVCNECGKSLVG